MRATFQIIPPRPSLPPPQLRVSLHPENFALLRAGHLHFLQPQMDEMYADKRDQEAGFLVSHRCETRNFQSIPSSNHDAPVICCTAEILANIALRDGANAAVDDVIMDEFHYYSDHARGTAWQIPLLTLPRARFLLMSAIPITNLYYLLAHAWDHKLSDAEIVTVDADSCPDLNNLFAKNLDERARK